MRQTLCDFYHYGQQQSAVVVTKRLTIKRAQTASSLRKSFRLKSKKSQSMNRRERDESRDETKLDDMGPFGRRVKALQMLIEAELELMRATLPIEYHSTVLDIVVAPGNGCACFINSFDITGLPHLFRYTCMRGAKCLSGGEEENKEHKETDA